jgi:hypothetical protein
MRANVPDRWPCSRIILCRWRGRLHEPIHIGEIKANRDQDTEDEPHKRYRVQRHSDAFIQVGSGHEHQASKRQDPADQRDHYRRYARSASGDTTEGIPWIEQGIRDLRATGAVVALYLNRRLWPFTALNS